MDANFSLRRSGSVLTSSCSTSPCRASTASQRRANSCARTGLRLVFLTVHEDADFAKAAIDAGGLGYVVKARLASDLLPAIRAALADRRFISPTLRLDEERLTFPDPPR